MQNNVDLSGLKDIIIPTAPAWFPPAPGWWVVIGCALGLCLLTLTLSYLWYVNPRTYALRELKQLKQTALSPTAFAKEASLLLKRIALLRFGVTNVAKLSAEKWEAFLNAHAKGTIDSKEIKFLAFSIYLPENSRNTPSIDSLYESVKRMIKQLFKEH